MKYRLLIIGLLITLSSCDSILLTENEDKAIDTVLDFFGGECSYSIGVSASTGNDEQKYFEPILGKSSALKKYDNNREIVTSKLCYIFFDNLNKKEKENYTHIRGTLIYDNGEKFSKDYSIKELEAVKAKLVNVNNVVSLIQQKDFNKLRTLLNDKATFRYDKNKLVESMETVDSEFGNITEYKMFGFNLTNAGNDEVLKIYGVVFRDKDNHELSVYLNPNSKNEEILKIEYKL
jgi:hypothetical protein